MRGHRPIIRAAVAGITMLLSAGGSTSAVAGQCGDTLTTDTTLTADQTCVGGFVTIGADGITLDLGGFTVSGDTTGTGVDVNGHRDVTIRNGIIRAFDDAILAIAPADGLELSRLTLRENDRSGATVAGGGIVVDRSFFFGNGFIGLHAAGLVLQGAKAKVTNSTFLSNNVRGLALFVNGAKIDNVIVTATDGDGVILNMSTGVAIRSSTIARNTGIGISFGATAASSLSKSTVVGNGSYGVEIDFAGGPPSGNTITGNLIAGNQNHGVYALNGSTGNSITKNRVIGNSGSGIFIETTAANTLVQGNRAIGNAGDGIANFTGTTTIAKNVADANGASGILVPFPSATVDGGGNKARGNVSTNCINMACPPAFTPKAGPTIPSCGMAVSTSIKLGGDLFCAGGNGLIVVADGVTIDLNGHTVNGGRIAGVDGIVVGDHSKVTIKNGIVANFDTGISASEMSADLRLVNVASSFNLGDGLRMAGTGGVVKNSIFDDNAGSGVFFGEASSPKVTSSYFVGNGDEGILAETGAGAFSKVVATVNGARGLAFDGLFGDGATVKNAVIAQNDTIGIGTNHRTITAITKSTIAGNGVGVTVGTTFLPVFAPSFTASLAGNLIVGNFGEGVHMQSSDRVIQLTKNDLVGNALGGIVIDGVAAPPQVVANRLIANNDGVLNSAATGTFGKNLAQGNFGAGIFTTQPATDAGKNRAFHNGGDDCTAPLVCLGQK